MSNIRQRIAYDYGDFISFQTISQDAVTAGGLTVPAKSAYAMVTADGAAVRARSDGTDPTTTVGHLYSDGSHIEVPLTELLVIKFIATAGTATLSVSYFGLS